MGPTVCTLFNIDTTGNNILLVPARCQSIFCSPGTLLTCRYGYPYLCARLACKRWIVSVLSACWKCPGKAQSREQLSSAVTRTTQSKDTPVGRPSVWRNVFVWNPVGRATFYSFGCYHRWLRRTYEIGITSNAIVNFRLNHRALRSR